MKRLFGLTAILFSMAFSQGVVTQLDKGSINYSDQTISAIGIGFVPQKNCVSHRSFIMSARCRSLVY